MWRVRQILIPACWLVESCAQVSFFTERAEFARYLKTIARQLIYHPKYLIDRLQVPVNPVHVLGVHRGTCESQPGSGNHPAFWPGPVNQLLVI